MLVGGVPGAGKSTALRRVGVELGVRVLDPDAIRGWLGARLPGVPYGRYRPLVHVVHTARVLARLLIGPGHGGPLLVHDPATRPRRRRWFARLARMRGWQPNLLLIDIDRGSARQGQLRRGRVVDLGCFNAHWRRWESIRADLDAGRGLVDRDEWHEIVVTDRSEATALLRTFCSQDLVAAA